MSQYRSQQNLSDFRSADELQELISKLINKELKHLKFDRHESAKILRIEGGVCDLGFQDNDTIIQNVKVREGLTVNVSDEVYVLLINGSPMNMIIDIKKR